MSNSESNSLAPLSPFLFVGKSRVCMVQSYDLEYTWPKSVCLESQDSNPFQVTNVSKVT